MVTADQVWAALDEIPDPEIPVISLVELGVVRDVAVEGMQLALESKITELGADPEVEVIRGDAWSTDRITPAGREKLRAAGFAPPPPREASAPRLVQLQAKAFRC